MATIINNKATAAATAIPTIAAKPMPVEAGTGGMDGSITELEDVGEAVLEAEVDDKTTGIEEESLAEIEGEGTATFVDVEKESADDERGSAEDETLTERETIMDESVGTGVSVEGGSDTVGSDTVGSGDDVSPTVKPIGKTSECEMVSATENSTI